MTQYICRCGHSSSEKIGERSRFCNACGQQLRVGDFGHSKNIRALVVEDSTLIRRRAKEVLESVGCSVENADNGKKALTMIKINPSDLVISDILMPDMDGLTMLSTLRADMQFKDLPVALLTSEGRGDIIGKAMKLGVLSDIEMPEMDGIELLKTIRRDLNLKDIPVIILTTLSDDEHITQTMNEGVMAYIIKTEITPASLRQQLKHHQTATVGHL